VSGRDEAATAFNRVFSSLHENCNHESRCGREVFQLNYVTKAVALTNSFKLGSHSLRRRRSRLCLLQILLRYLSNIF